MAWQIPNGTKVIQLQLSNIPGVELLNSSIISSWTCLGEDDTTTPQLTPGARSLYSNSTPQLLIPML